MFDNSYFASTAGGAANEWQFSTPPVTLALAATYKAALSIVSPQLCSGDILELPTMCCAEYQGGTPVRTAVGHRVVINFSLHEVQPAKLLLKYAPGDTITGETFTRSTTATYRDINGLVATASINVKRAAHYDTSDLTANSPSLLLENSAHNIALWNRDLSDAASAVWTKTNMTATKNQVGADGAANAATALVATAGNATCTQAVTAASSVRKMSAYVFRGVGTGPIEMTTDGGTTWTPVTLGGIGVYFRVSIPAQTLANPNFGFRIVTSGDAIGVDYVQNETGTVMTSAIPTTTVAVTRETDLYSLPFITPPQEMTVYLKFIERGTISIAGTAFLLANTSSASAALAGHVAGGGFYTTTHLNVTVVTSTLATASVYNDTVELCFRLFGDGSVDVSQSINGGAVATATQSAALALAAAWSGLLFWPNGASASARGFTAFKSAKIIAGARSLAEMRTL